MASELEELEQERSEAVLAMHSEIVDGKMKPRDAPHVRTVRLAEPVEVWWRDPLRAIQHLPKLGFPNYVTGAIALRRVRQPMYHVLNDALPSGTAWKLWVVDYGEHAAYLYNKDTPPDRLGKMTPLDRAPMWMVGDDPDDLVKLCRTYEKAGWDRIFVVGPKISSGPTRSEHSRVFDYLHRVGAAFPQVRLHLNSAQPFRLAFGLNFAAADIDMMHGTKGFITLPNGRTAKVDQLSRHLKWVHVLGFSVPDLATVEGRVAFNLHSALWAAENYSSEEALAKTRHHNPGRTDPLGLFTPPGAKERIEQKRVRRVVNRRLEAPVHDPDKQPQMTPADHGIEPYHMAEPVTNLPLVPVQPRKKTSYDKILCDPCSLKDTCRYFRDGGLCILPSSPSSSLARLFATRDAEQIQAALSSVLQHQADRLDRISKVWDSESPEDVSTEETIKRSEHQMKLENSLARGAEAMIKILDPSQRTPSTIPAINAGTVHVYNPQVLVADLVKRLEAAGVRREDIDPSKIIEVARSHGMLES